MADWKILSVGLPADVAVDILAQAALISQPFSGATLDTNNEKFAETLRYTANVIRLWQPGDTHGEIIFEAEGSTSPDASLALKISIRTVSVRSVVDRSPVLIPAPPLSPDIAEAAVVKKSKRRVSVTK